MLLQRFLLQGGTCSRLKLIEKSVVQSSNASRRTISRYSSSLTANKQFTVTKFSRTISTPSSSNYGRYEPDYLDPSGPQVASYELVNIQIKGYDFTVLEEFAKFVHNSAERFGFEVEDAWGTPSKHLKITRLKPESTIVDAEYKLQLYERNVQLAYPESTKLPLFVDMVHSSLPAGVTLKVHPHFKEHTEVRFIPDFQLREMRTLLEDLTSDRKKK